MTTPQNNKSRLVIFDVEGVLIPKNRYFLEIGKSLGFSQSVRIILYGFLYELGLISLESALKHVFKLFKGIKIEELLRILKKVPLMPDAQGVFEKLRIQGWKTALISSGLPTVVVKDLASTLKADFAFGLELETKNDVLTGEIWGDVIKHNGKFKVLSRILQTEGITPKDCIVVADDRNNASIFLRETLKIGYNPDFLIRTIADNVVTGKLLDIMPLVGGKPKKESSPSKNDIFREAVHASAFFVPAVSSLIGFYTFALITLTVTILYVISEFGRMEKRSLPLISSVTHRAVSQTELHEFATAPIFFALGILLTLMAFPAPTSSAAIAIFALGDSAASFFGGLFRGLTLPFNKGKTLAGSTIGFFFAFLGGLFFISPLGALVGAAIAMIIECLPLPVNDNLAIPLITGAALAFIV